MSPVFLLKSSSASHGIVNVCHVSDQEYLRATAEVLVLRALPLETYT